MCRPDSSHSGSARLAVLSATLLAMLLPGCREHFDRRDTLTRASGNALEINAATQTIDPWPPEEWTKVHNSDGKRTLQTIDAYQTRKKPTEDEAVAKAEEKTTN